jgi:hypothetical protein
MSCSPQLPAAPPVSVMFGSLQPFFTYSNFCHLLLTRTGICSCHFCFCLVTSNCLRRPCPTVDYRKPSGTQMTVKINSGGKGWPWGIPVTFYKSAVILSLCSSVRYELLLVAVPATEQLDSLMYVGVIDVLSVTLLYSWKLAIKLLVSVMATLLCTDSVERFRFTCAWCIWRHSADTLG